MNFIAGGTIRRSLSLLIIFIALPALGIIVYTGMEQRRTSLVNAENEVAMLAHSMAEVQKNMAVATRQLLSTLALLPEIQTPDIEKSRDLFKNVIAKNPDYLNLSLVDLDGKVMSSGKAFSGVNLGDRKHFREALETRDFAVGEYIITRIGSSVPALAFAYPVLDEEGRPRAVLATTISLDRFSFFYNKTSLPDRSFVAITDHKGIRLFTYPPDEEVRPIGGPIRANIWERAERAVGPGVLTTEGSDGIRRIMAFEQVRLTADAAASLYAWAALPEGEILKAGNYIVLRNVLLMFLATLIFLTMALVVARRGLLLPIRRLVGLTRGFAEGRLDSPGQERYAPEELRELTRAFHEMADSLTLSQRALKEDEARFRLLTDSIDAIVYVSDMTTYEILFINKHGRELFGDVAGRICWQSIQQNQEGPCPFCTNRYLVDEDGSPAEVYAWEFQNTSNGRWYYIKDRAIRWVDGRIVRLEVATDITKKKMTEADLAEKTERLAVTLRSIGEGVITTNIDGRVELINRAAESLTGWSSEAAVGRPLSEIFNITCEGDSKPCAGLLDRVLSAGETVALPEQTKLMAKNGQVRDIADSGAPIRDEHGAIIGMVLVFRDITEQLRTRQEMLKIKKLESIGVLAGGIAHDFNNILAAIIGNIDLSRLDDSLNERTRSLLGEAEKASWRARDLTLQLLTFAKGGEPIKEAAALSEVVKDSADFVLRGSKVACSYSFPDNLWLVEIDKGQISQVVQNIILNAGHAMPAGGVIEVTAENVSPDEADRIGVIKKGRYVKMSISDTGIGIAPGLLEKIFDPYFSTKQQGSGLGLAIAHSIISRHGGKISVESALGKGSTFTIYLPASEESAVTAPKSEEGPLQTMACRILVMDDDISIREMTRSMLSEMGHNVTVAADGKEAVQLYREAVGIGRPIDMTIMDLTVPGGMGGTEAVREILAIDPEAKVIVSSGYSNDPVMANFRDYGFCGAIAKPYQIKELARLIGKFLEPM